jgi:hypothetical protein
MQTGSEAGSIMGPSCTRKTGTPKVASLGKGPVKGASLRDGRRKSGVDSSGARIAEPTKSRLTKEDAGVSWRPPPQPLAANKTLGSGTYFLSGPGQGDVAQREKSTWVQNGQV